MNRTHLSVARWVVLWPEPAGSTSQSQIYRLSLDSLRSGDALPVLRTRQGDLVTLVVRSDRPGELYVHEKQDRQTLLNPGHDVTLSFVAAQRRALPDTSARFRRFDAFFGDTGGAIQMRIPSHRSLCFCGAVSMTPAISYSHAFGTPYCPYLYGSMPLLVPQFS